MRAFEAGLRSLEKEMLSRMGRLVNTKGVPGTRADLPKVEKSDKKTALRMNYGETITKDDNNKYQTLNLQINMDVEDPALATLKREPKHKKRAQATVKLGSQTEAEEFQAFTGVFNGSKDDFERRSESRMSTTLSQSL